MKRTMYLKIFFLSVLAASLLSGISLLLLIRLADVAAAPHREDFLLFLTDSVERKVSGLSIAQIKAKQEDRDFEIDFPGVPRPGPHPDFHPESAPPGLPRAIGPSPMLPPGDFDDGPPPGPRPPGSPQGPPTGRRSDAEPNGNPSVQSPALPWRFGRPPKFADHLWLVTEDGAVVYNHAKLPLETAWASLPKPINVHQIASDPSFLRYMPGTFVIKLNHTPTLYLVFRDEHKPMSGPLLFTQAALTFGTVAAALFFSLSFIFFYLRRKSEEARTVLFRLEKGDLKARFEIKRFDEFGGLLLGFNRMAQEIENLVARIHSTESTRRNLLQELGHDLRTPLTSLTTSFELLKFHFNKMSDAERNDLFEMVGAEVEYLKELLDKLMTIATLDEPNYKQATESLNLSEIINHEVKTRTSASVNGISWSFDDRASNQVDSVVTGDPHLIQRLIKNGFDNAARFAKTRVVATLERSDKGFEISIADDGKGLNEKEIEVFGKRREQRRRREGDRLNFSLGLGSVIMKAIVELHHGRLEIGNEVVKGEVRGARLRIFLPFT